MKKFGWAVIGCGGIANTVAKEIVEEGSGKIVACWNRTKARAEQFAARFGCRAYDTAEEAITATGVEGVYIATTHDMHGYYTKLCIEHGVPVLCEKPFTVNYKEAEEVFALAKKRGTYVAEAMWTWFNSPAHTVREWVREGKVGKIQSVYASFACPLLETCSNPRLTSPELIGGALMDIGVYPVRYILELFGMPQSIAAKGALLGGVDIEETIVLDYGTFKAELLSSVRKEEPETLVIRGTEGEIVVPNFHMTREGRLTGKHNDAFTCDALLYGTQCKIVAEEIRAGKTESDCATWQAVLDTMAVLDECRRQLGVVYPCEKQ